MTSIGDWIFITFGIDSSMQQRIAASLLVLLVFWFIRRLVISIVVGKTEDIRIIYRWRKSTTYAAFVLGRLDYWKNLV